MPKKIAMTRLNASTIDILNVIRQNAPQAYQDSVPKVNTIEDIPKVGQIIYGTSQLSNTFINALVNRIALVKVNSAVFNNAYAELKKGYLEFGETVEEVFIQITKAREFSAEKAEARELKRSLPDVKAVFHNINWKVQYPITIEDVELQQAFLSARGVEDLIAKIVGAISTANEYDEFLLFKYLLIKAVTKGQMSYVSFDGSDIKNAAKKFRGTSNKFTFMSTKYNNQGVTTTTPKTDQYIFMDSDFNAEYDVDVLASAFNMDKATFQGQLKLIDDFTSFDNDRFDIIREGSEMVELVTNDELALMSDVKAILLDKEWFQVYDNVTKMTEQYVASGMYWNYFYNIWKTVSYSPFSQAVAFVDETTPTPLPASFTVTVDSVVKTEEGTTIITLDTTLTDSLVNQNLIYTQTEQATKDLIAIQKYGAVIFGGTTTSVALEATVDGVVYKTAVGGELESTDAVGTTLTLSK